MEQTYYTMQRGDVDKPALRILGGTWLTCDWIGRILPSDVGKRVYLVGGILQVENDEQRAERIAKSI